MLVIDLRAWRAEGIEDRAIQFIHRHAHQLRTFDQDALNAVLAGRWGASWTRAGRSSRVPSNSRPRSPRTSTARGGPCSGATLGSCTSADD
jgi:hypothetical protein